MRRGATSRFSTKNSIDSLEEQVEADKEDDDDKRSGRLSGILKREKQVERLKKQADRIENFLRENGPKMGKQGREIKSNITDNESATMVTSRGTVQGYNGQAMVDSKSRLLFMVKPLETDRTIIMSPLCLMG